MTAPAVFRAPGHACDAECWYAHSGVDSCVCSCGGVQHGVRRVDYPALTAAEIGQTVAAVVRDPFARIPVVDDEPW